MTIGVLDDDPALCHILAIFLTRAGHKVYACTDPLTFVAQDNIDHFECIVVDFHLAGEKSGIDIIRQMKQTTPHLPAILISSDRLSRATLQGLSNVILCQKPLRLITLLAVLKRIREE